MADGINSLRVALTREAADNAALAGLLAAAGIGALSCPLVRVELIPPAEVTLARTGYDWLAVTSRRALAWLDWRRGLPGAPTFARVGCVGTATAEYARAVMKLDPLVPVVQTAAALAKVMGEVRGLHVLFPRGDLARDTLATALCDRGSVVDDPIVYRTSAAEPGASKLAEMIAENKVNAVAFASPSAVRFAMQAGADLASVRCFSIGPTTSDELKAHGLAVAAQASPHDANGLAAAIVAHARGQSA